NGLFLSLFITSGISVFLAGTAWIVHGVPSLVFLNRLLNALLFTDNYMLVLLVWRFECFILNVDERLKRIVNGFLQVSFLPSVFCALVNIFYPFFFSVDALGVYHREPLFPISIVICLPALAGITAGIFKSKGTKKEKFIFSSFVGFPLFILGLSLLKFQSSFLEPAMFVSIVVIYHMIINVRAKKAAVTQSELHTAAEIQHSMLPSTFPPFPERTEFELYASMTPAREVGGDYYDFAMLDDDHLALLIADVSDKGTPAALFMMSTKNLINYRMRQGGTPAEILTDVNKHVARDNRSKMFVTVWMGILDLKTGVMTCVNAGHEYPAVCGADGVFRIFKDKHGLVVGAMENLKYRDYELFLEPGTRVFVYTDGVPDASNAAGERYGKDRLEAALNTLSEKDPEGIIRGIRADVDAFVDGAKQFDDLTMLCLEFKGAEVL
ncbi:MAG: serine/threonine-protein phosphatase, partial [Anaerolineaceae bacterium]|nr:serine/threonine-protein phosphatase [Anaerolineaceae bacterium]